LGKKAFFLLPKILNMVVGGSTKTSQPREMPFVITPLEGENCEGVLWVDFDLCKDVNYNDQRAL
jgi:hypothetical protein